MGERQLPVDTVLAELADTCGDVVGGGARQIVVLHEHPAEVTAGPGLTLHAHHVGAVLVPDAGGCGTLEVLGGEALVEDVIGHRDVVVGREDLGAGGQPEIPAGMAAPILRRPPKAFGRIEGGAQSRHRCDSNRDCRADVTR